MKSQSQISEKSLKKSIKSEEENVNLKIEKLKSEREKRVENTFKDITEQIQRYIATKFLISLLTGVIVGVVYPSNCNDVNPIRIYRLYNSGRRYNYNSPKYYRESSWT